MKQKQKTDLRGLKYRIFRSKEDRMRGPKFVAKLYDLQTGRVGGFVPGYGTLSHRGHAWIHNTPHTFVFDRSIVCENAVVYSGDISQSSVIGGHAWIDGAVIQECMITGYVFVIDNKPGMVYHDVVDAFRLHLGWEDFDQYEVVMGHYR